MTASRKRDTRLSMNRQTRGRWDSKGLGESLSCTFRKNLRSNYELDKAGNKAPKLPRETPATTTMLNFLLNAPTA